MVVFKNKSRNKNSVNQVKIIMEIKCEKSKEMQKEIKKAIRRWNRLLEEKLSYEIKIVNRDSNFLED